jgi:hypothetical protein
MGYQSLAPDYWLLEELPDALGPTPVYLASDASRFMAESVLVIDGGYTLW